MLRKLDRKTNGTAVRKVNTLPTHRRGVPLDGSQTGLRKAVQNHQFVDVRLFLLKQEVLQRSVPQLLLVELDQPKVLEKLVRVPARHVRHGFCIGLSVAWT